MPGEGDNSKQGGEEFRKHMVGGDVTSFSGAGTRGAGGQPQPDRVFGVGQSQPSPGVNEDHHGSRSLPSYRAVEDFVMPLRQADVRPFLADADDRIQRVVIFIKRADGQTDFRPLSQCQRPGGLQDTVFVSRFYSDGHD